MFGRSNTTGRSRLGGSTRSRQSRSAAILPSNAFSTALRAMVSASPSSSASTAMVVLLREPFGRPRGFPLLPLLNGRPRGIFAVLQSKRGHVSWSLRDCQTHPQKQLWPDSWVQPPQLFPGRSSGLPQLHFVSALPTPSEACAFPAERLARATAQTLRIDVFVVA